MSDPCIFSRIQINPVFFIVEPPDQFIVYEIVAVFQDTGFVGIVVFFGFIYGGCFFIEVDGGVVFKMLLKGKKQIIIVKIIVNDLFAGFSIPFDFDQFQVITVKSLIIVGI